MRYELISRFEGARGAFRRNLGARAGFVVGHGLEIVSLGQKNSLIGIETRVVLRQSQKFRLHAVMCLVYFGGALENESLRRVEARKIGGAPGVFVEPDAKHDLATFKMPARLGEEAACLRGHNASPLPEFRA